jgi:cysteinyl-tRNA synthetase
VRLRSLGEAPQDGPWAAPAVLRAEPAGDRPIGVSDAIAGHGGDPRSESLSDRAHRPAAPLSPAGRTLHDDFVSAIDDDLDLPTALAVVRELLRSDLEPDERRWLALDADFVLGLDLHRVWDVAESIALPADVQSLADERAAARAASDYHRSDELRNQLSDLGWSVKDAPGGQELTRTRR